MILNEEVFLEWPWKENRPFLLGDARGEHWLPALGAYRTLKATPRQGRGQSCPGMSTMPCSYWPYNKLVINVRLAHPVSQFSHLLAIGGVCPGMPEPAAPRLIAGLSLH